jgi:hypothetical protein
MHDYLVLMLRRVYYRKHLRNLAIYSIMRLTFVAYNIRLIFVTYNIALTFLAYNIALFFACYSCLIKSNVNLYSVHACVIRMLS